MRFSKTILAIAFSMPLALYAQMSLNYDNELNTYNRGLELYEKEKFGAAKDQFEQAVQVIHDQNSEISANAHFYIAACALELFHKDSEFLLKEFVRNYSTSPRVREAWFLLGNYNYRKRKWEKAINFYDEIEANDLKEPMRSEYLFKRGYAHFQEDQLDEAAGQFFQMNYEESVFHAPGVYYLGHINYLQGKYAAALKAFQSLESHDQFGEVVPYYIVQIHHYQEDYDALVSYGKPFLENKQVKRRAEISRLIGEALYNKEAFDEAIPFLEDYMSTNYGKSKEDHYVLGYSYYKSGQYDEASEQFSQISYGDDAMGQNASYHLGESYLRAGRKSYARNAYRSASQLDYSPKLKEDALFKFALLSYELSYDPYDGAIAAFKEYIAAYPNTDRTKEAYDYLVNIYLTSKNYDAALSSIEEYENPDIRLQEAYQRIAYNKGVSLFQDQKFNNAMAYLDKSLKFPQSKTIAAKATYWKAESEYRLGNFKRAIKGYEDFIYSPGAVLTPYFNLANYNIGYAYFEQDKFIEAPSWFRRFTSYRQEKDEAKLADAGLRIGDCYFMLNQYDAAYEYYDMAVANGKSDPDYALYQKGMTQGLLKKPTEKLSTLTSLTSKYPESHYLDAAFYEIGRTNISLGKDEEALKNLNRVVNDYPGSSYVRKALVSIGQTYYNQQKDEEALAVFMKIIADYPTYEDTREALIGVQNIYTDNGKVDQYEELIGSLDFVNISDMALDSINYESAENQYFNGQCKEAVAAFDKYLNRFDKGIFTLNAKFYRAECLSRMGQDAKALTDYEFVANQPKNKFSESALVKAARANLANESYPEALAYYKRLTLLGQYKSNLLESEIGQMKCNYALNNYQGAIANAVIALDEEKIDPSVRDEAHMIIAKSNLKLNDIPEGQVFLQKVMDQGSPSMAAEAMYLTARVQFNLDSLDSAEAIVFKVVETHSSQSFWLAKSLVLLSDIYMSRGDLFQAKATLTSVLDNYTEEDEVKAMAREKLQTIEEIEAQSTEEEAPDIEIDLGGSTTQEIETISNDTIDNE